MEVVTFTVSQTDELMYAARHLAGSENYPDDPHAGDSFDLGLDHITWLVQEKIGEAFEAFAKEHDRDDAGFGSFTVREYAKQFARTSQRDPAAAHGLG